MKFTIEQIIKMIENKAEYILSSAREHERLENEHRAKKETWYEAHQDMMMLLREIKGQ